MSARAIFRQQSARSLQATLASISLSETLTKRIGQLSCKGRRPGIPEGSSGSRPTPYLNLEQKFCLVARARVGGSGWCRSLSGANTVPGQPRKEGRDLKRHLVTRRGDGDRSRLHHFRLIVPGVDLHTAAQRQG